MSEPRTYDATLIRVIDGDTCWLLVELGFDILTRLEIRLADLNAPELEGEHAKEGLAAKNELQRLLSLGPLRITTRGRDKYGRQLASIQVQAKSMKTPLLVNENLIANGFAKPWDGKGVKPARATEEDP